MKKRRNIVLIGFMGSGKTSIGMKLARVFSYEFLDSDCRIEEEQQKTINEIFAEQGEAAFRDMETELARLFTEEFTNDIDNIALAISKVNDIRAKYKMELIVWDTTPPQAGSGARGNVYREYLSSTRKELR